MLRKVEDFMEFCAQASAPEGAGILSLRPGCEKGEYYQVMAALKLVTQDEGQARKFKGDDKRAAFDVGDRKPFVERRASLLAMHHVGTGKTILGILAMAMVHRYAYEAEKKFDETVPAKKTVIIAPKSVVPFWEEKVKEWTVLVGAQVLVVRKHGDVVLASGLEKLKKAAVVITTPDVLQGAMKWQYKRKTSATTKKPLLDEGNLIYKSALPGDDWHKNSPEGKGYERTHNLFKLLAYTGSDGPHPSQVALTIVDEVHQNAAPWTWKGAGIRMFTKGSMYRLGLSGTPVTHHPSDLAHLAELLDVRVHSKGKDERLLMQRADYFQEGADDKALDKEALREFQRLFTDRVRLKHLSKKLPKFKDFTLWYDPFIGLRDDATVDAKVVADHNKALRDAKLVVADEKAPSLITVAESAPKAKAAGAEDGDKDAEEEEEDEEAPPEAPAAGKWSNEQTAAFSAVIKLGNYEFSPLLGEHGAKWFKHKSAGTNRIAQAAELPSQAMQLIGRVVRDRQERGHPRITVFAEQVTQLEILRSYLETLDVGEVFLFHGQLEPEKRTEMVKDFLTCEKGVLLLSKAGGVGLNLQHGCEVMLLVGSLPWNAADVDQAKGRVYRMGQDKQVEIIQFVARRSVTAAKKRLHEDKRDRLEAAIVNQDFGNFADGSSTWRESRDMLSYVADLDTATGNYTVSPGFLEEVEEGMRKRRKFEAEEAKWLESVASGVTTTRRPHQPKFPPTKVALPVLPSRMALPEVSFPL